MIAINDKYVASYASVEMEVIFLYIYVNRLWNEAFKSICCFRIWSNIGMWYFNNKAVEVVVYVLHAMLQRLY